MKKIILLLAALTIGFANAKAQFGCTCLPEGITLSTQEQIDNFQTNYPGCTGILGSVIIYGSDITNLNGLSVLISIGGNLIIGRYYGGQGNPLLSDLNGLENLTYIGGSIVIAGNNALTSLTGLESLNSIGGNLTIGGIWNSNPSLTSLTGLQNLTSIGGYMQAKRTVNIN